MMNSGFSAAELLARAIESRAVIGLMMSLGITLMSGCGVQDNLPPPGAPGLVRVHLWEESGGPPAYLQAERVEQAGAVFEKLQFITVMMRISSNYGVVYVSAPCARYERGAAEEIVLSALDNQPIDGPVRFLGTWQGEVFMGRAERAVFEEATHRMRLDQVEFVFQGLHQRTAFVAVTEERIVPFGALQRMPNAPSLTAALGALPSPLVLPAIQAAKN